MTATEKELWALRVKTEHTHLIDNLVYEVRQFKARQKENPHDAGDPEKMEFQLVIDAEVNLTMFECMHDIPATDWKDLV